MRFSKFLLPTIKENPTGCDSVAMRYMVRAGLIRKVSAGMFNYLPYFNMIMRKVEYQIRRGMDRANSSEVKFPLLVSQETLEKSGRWTAFGKEMFSLKDRNGNGFAISPTNEEYATLIAGDFVKSYNDLPFSVYQVQRKYRDEIRPRNGVVRAREFTMKDAYSFHANEKDLLEYYNVMRKEYINIFSSLGIKVVPVLADSGAMGGNFCEEFMAISEEGEADIAYCESCGLGANLETVPTIDVKLATNKKGEFNEILTPHSSTIDELMKFLKMPANKFVKSMVYNADGKLVMALVRGDRVVNEAKLARVVGATLLELASATDIEKMGSVVGFVGPVGKLKNVTIIADNEIKALTDFVIGANKRDYHLIGVNNADFKANYADIRFAEAGDICPKCGKPLAVTKGNELGHIFALGKRYTERFGTTYINADNKPELLYMGCYGIGLERTVASIIDQHHDEKGLLLPMNVAPFKVNIVLVDPSKPEQATVAEMIYNNLEDEGIPVLLDDRKKNAGAKFADHELIGVPIRITVGRGVQEGKVEVQLYRGELNQVEISKVEDVVKKIIKEA